jgi:DNA-binding PadR family transcriptional regulator
MPGGRATSNPLALAVLACLHERPMHPYEMASTMRERGKEHSIKLNYGSLYTVVDNLAKHGLIEAVEARREGRRPERTVYRLTDAGRIRLDSWMSELLATPVKEYPQFEAALSLLPVLPPEEATALLEERVHRLEEAVGRMRSGMDAARATGVARLFLIEHEYELALQEAELRWVRGIVREIKSGTLGGVREWEALHSAASVADADRTKQDR